MTFLPIPYMLMLLQFSRCDDSLTKEYVIKIVKHGMKSETIVTT
jgi:hypothetical protein